MRMLDIAIPTGVIRSGMTVEDVFRECAERRVPVLPFCDSSGKVLGQISLRHIVRASSIPEYMLKSARLLGDKMEHPDLGEEHFRTVLDHPAEKYVLEKVVVVSADAPVAKVLSQMEESGKNHVLLVEQGEYRGVITRHGIAALILHNAGRGG